MSQNTGRMMEVAETVTGRLNEYIGTQVLPVNTEHLRITFRGASAKKDMLGRPRVSIRVNTNIDMHSGLVGWNDETKDVEVAQIRAGKEGQIWMLRSVRRARIGFHKEDAEAGVMKQVFSIIRGLHEKLGPVKYGGNTEDCPEGVVDKVRHALAGT